MNWQITRMILVAALAMLTAGGVAAFVRLARGAGKSLARQRAPIAVAMLALAVVCTGIAQKRGGGEGETSRVERVEGGGVMGDNGRELMGDNGRAASPRPPYSRLLSGESTAIANPYGALGESALPESDLPETSNRDCLVPNHCGADGVRALPVRGGAQGYSVTAEDVSRGWRVESVTTNAVFGYQGEYTNRVDNIDWRKHGGYKMRCRVDFGDFEFPYGDTTLNGAIALTGGTLWSLPTAGPRQVVCAGLGYASFVRQTSSFWSADADNGAKLLTWENVFSNRDLTGQYSAQIELRQNGDFMLRSNCVETVCRRINSDDSDGDGLPDDVDPNPTTWDGNYLGTSVAWYNAQCGNVLSAWDDDGVIRIEWNDGVCSNAYYWLDVIVSGARGKVTGTVRITCDGPSNLGNMIVIAPTNEVCHIPLLAGAGYVVESELPIASATASDSRAEMGYLWDFPWNRGRRVTLPLSADAIAPSDGGSHYAFSTSIDVGATLLSVSNACCTCVVCDGGFNWTCDGYCTCNGGTTNDLWAYVSWEGYARSFLLNLSCSCREEPEQVTSDCLALDMPSVVFVNNDDDDDDLVPDNLDAFVPEDDDLRLMTLAFDPPSPTNGVLELQMLSGATNVAVWIDADKSTPAILPRTFSAESFEGASFYLEGVAHSASVGDVAAAWKFTGADGVACCVTQTLTVVEVEHLAVSLFPTNRVRRTLGVAEEVWITASPVGIVTNMICDGGEIETLSANLIRPGCDGAIFRAPHHACGVSLAFAAEGDMLSRQFTIVEPSGLVVDGYDSWYADNVGYAGLFGIDFSLRLTPTNVSFRSVELMEVPRVSADATGYFLLDSCRDSLDHGKRGAGEWKSVRSDNVNFDKVTFGYCPPPWNGGGAFTWPIPLAWRCLGDDSVTNVFMNTDQRFELDADGTARIRKFGYCGERDTNAHFTVRKETP